MPFDHDVLVAGAGPVGCATALAFARRGARVALVDPAPDEGDRFAGELLHPRAVDALRALGVDDLDCWSGHHAVDGYVVSRGPEQPHQVLGYGRGTGRTFLFPRFAAALRAHAADTDGITWMPGVRVVRVDGQTAHLEPVGRGRGPGEEHTAGLIVAATGKHAALHPTPTARAPKEGLSRMAGLLLRGVTLPHEGHGHVALGPAGPALIYRVADDAVRICLDVPSPWFRAGDRNQRLADAYLPVLPESLRSAVRQALADDDLAWAINSVRPRASYGRRGFVAVGDAVGHVHPMTAVGMTLGFEDALGLARARSLEEHAAARQRDTQVPVLLATALYEIFSLDTEPTAALREAVFHLWATDPRLRARTMDFLACEETRFSRLLGVGSRIVARAATRVALDRSLRGEWWEAGAGVSRVSALVRWLVTESVPDAMKIPGVEAAITPFAPLRRQLQDRRQAELTGRL